MAEEAQYRRHRLDRVAQRGWRLNAGSPQCAADIDQVAQYLELNRRAARAVPAIVQDLPPQLAIEEAQHPGDAALRAAESDEPADQSLDGAQLRRPIAFWGHAARQMAKLHGDARQHLAPQGPVDVAAGQFVEVP